MKQFADMRALNDALMLLTEGDKEEEGEIRGEEEGGGGKGEGGGGRWERKGGREEECID